MERSTAQKLGVKTGMRAIFVNSEKLESTFGLPDVDLKTRLSAEFDFIMAFFKTQSEFKRTFPKLKIHLKKTGMLWLSWPKSRKLNSDLNLPKIIEIGYTFGLVESKTVSIDETWSAIKFTHPKKGKIYENSFGTLPENHS
ncbi:hypothetical protein [Flavobacterium sp.]|uniref:hypothetical protein n=1 Tax=Flavobacterium sp. TaxID=239 RepID=UPI00121879B9|nr:hypothetical protein [Flavobacterium sp.]RZJ73625.1 MAG: DUF3052 family protein [Flavobacterium sp.]